MSEPEPDKKVIWNAFIEQAKTDLLANETNYHGKKKDLIRKLAYDLEQNGMPVDMIAREVVQALHDCNVTERYILAVLDEKYKRGYKRYQELENRNSSEVDDKKVLVHSTNGASHMEEPRHDIRQPGPEPKEEHTPQESAEVAAFNQQVREEVTQPRRQEYDALLSKNEGLEADNEYLRNRVAELNPHRGHWFKFDMNNYELTKPLFNIVMRKERPRQFYIETMGDEVIDIAEFRPS